MLPTPAPTRAHLRAPALAALLVASLALLPAPASAGTCTSSGVQQSPSCVFRCAAGNGTSVGMASRSGGEVTGHLKCPTSAADCHSWGSCTAYGPTEQQTGDGSCWGEAANGDGTITCAAGRDPGSGLATIMGLVRNVCDSVAYTSLGLQSVTVLLVSADPYLQESSFSWSPTTGCVHTPPVCHPHSVGTDGLVCGIGPGFYWRSPV
jgi:hypothetical protein